MGMNTNAALKDSNHAIEKLVLLFKFTILCPYLSPEKDVSFGYYANLKHQHSTTDSCGSSRHVEASGVIM